MLSENETPVIAITGVDNGTVAIKCTDITDIESGAVYFAVYDGEGSLLQLKTSDLAEDIEFNNVTSGTKYKAFMWNDISPLCASSTVEVQ